MTCVPPPQHLLVPIGAQKIGAQKTAKGGEGKGAGGETGDLFREHFSGHKQHSHRRSIQQR